MWLQSQKVKNQEINYLYSRMRQEKNSEIWHDSRVINIMYELICIKYN